MGLIPVLLARAIEVHSAVQHPGVCERYVGLAQLGGAGRELVDGQHAVEQRVIGVGVEVDVGHQKGVLERMSAVSSSICSRVKKKTPCGRPPKASLWTLQ